jgi:hypothetical protein
MTLICVGTSDQKRSALEIVVSGTGEYGPKVHCACAAPSRPPSALVLADGTSGLRSSEDEFPPQRRDQRRPGPGLAADPVPDSVIGDGAAPSPISESGTGDGPPQCGGHNRTKT